jgi:hypothetical protein
MRTALLCAVGVAILFIPPVAAPAAPLQKFSMTIPLGTNPSAAGEFVATQPAAARSETLWFFDADFEDLEGDNAGWTTVDASGTDSIPNHWHHDTLRISGHPAMGESTWWCGTAEPCGEWRQPRGYGNLWTEYLWRAFPEVAPTDTVISLEFDQRFAMEHNYDYGYVDVSVDGGATWSATVARYCNPGYVTGHPGKSQDWDSPIYGHPVLDLSQYSGGDLAVRFRFESSYSSSSQDSYDDPLWHSYLDGAWQLDNLTLKVNGETVWYDDCEHGNNGWQHPEVPVTGQAGVTFFRGQYGIDFVTNRDPMPGEPPVGTWMYAAVDTVTSRMVDGQDARLRSPPIDLQGTGPDQTPATVMQLWFWADCPNATGDVFGFHSYHSSDRSECVYQAPDEDWTGQCHLFYWYDDTPQWVSGWNPSATLWPLCVGHRWFGFEWFIENGSAPPPGVQHWAGTFLDRVRIGYVVTTSVPEDEPPAFAVSAVLPNPSRSGATRILYTLPATSDVSVCVYDLTGRVVRTLVDGPVEPGEHEAVWDGLTDAGARAASGVYFVKLLGGAGLASEAKLVLLK